MELFCIAAVVLHACMCGLTKGITVTSSKTIENFVMLDVSSNLKEYIGHEEIRLRIISNDSRYEDEEPLVKQRIQELKTIHKELIKNKTSNAALSKTAMDNHPTSVLAAIRNFLYNWEDKLANKTLYGSRLEEFLKRKHKVFFPTRDDLYRASAAITFLENVYNVTKADFVKGVIKGHQGTPLNPADCYYIGKVSMEAKMLDDAEEWMRIALASIDLTSNNINKEATFNVTDAMVILARILYTKENKDEAITLLEKATEIDSDDMVLHNLFLTHRFGRKVTTVDSVEVDPILRQFFELCGNLSLGRSIVNKTRKPRALKCRYKAYGKTPYWRFREEIVNNHPFISIIHGFVGDDTIASVLSAFHERAFREEPLPGGRTGQLWQSKIRTLMDFYKTAVRDISSRVSYVTGLGVRQKKGRVCHGEPLHLIDFGPGGTYSPHRDIEKLYLPSYMGITNRARLSTFHLFMSDTKEGGHLVFPELNIGIKPEKGMAVHVYNYKPSGIPEPNLLAGLCPVLVGQSKVLQKGIFSTGLDDNVLCGKKSSSTYFSVEKARACIAGPCGAPNTYT